MSYLKEFQTQVDTQQFANFMQLWEEYCMVDVIDGPELLKVLQIIKNSKAAVHFGKHIETTLPLLEQVKDQNVHDEILKVILDLQTTHSPKLADLATNYLKNKYQNVKNFNEKMRLVGLRNRTHFQGAISNFELLNHMENEKFVFHTGGWGVGEILEFSLVREHVVLEFEGIAGKKDISFDNAFNNLIRIPSSHFLARRFGDPDNLEKEGREDPVGLIKMLLRDLGPKTAAEIKDELCDLVIPEDDWTKWWQSARSKIKKDVQVKAPENLKEAFELREVDLSHEDRFTENLKKFSDINEAILEIYNFIRDFPETLKNLEFKNSLITFVLNLLNNELPNQKNKKEVKEAQELQIYLLLDDLSAEGKSNRSLVFVKELENIDAVLSYIEIAAFKKRVLALIRETKKQWMELFLHLLFIIPQNNLKDYLLKELLSSKESQEPAQSKLFELITKGTVYPEAFLWYFQKIIGEEEVPLSDKENQRRFLETFLILLHYIEQKVECRDLVKKMHNLLTAKRYAMVRSIIEGSSVEYLREFLLLVSKCQSLSKQDLKILQSLAEVVQPSLTEGKKNKESGEEEVQEIIWTTSQGYQKIKERIHHIATVETVDNAREIEAARALGDLRENSEYKFALERRSRLQAELKMLSNQINKARILTKEDIDLGVVGVGSVVDVVNPKGEQVTYQLLGPWDADPDNFILSFQSKLAQAMIGKKMGEKFAFQGENFVVKGIRSYL